MSLRWIFGGKKSMYFCKMGFDLPFSGTLNPMKSSRKLSEPSLRRDVRFYDVMPASCIIDTIYRHEMHPENGNDLPKRSPEIVTIFEGTISQRWYLRN